MFNDKSYLKGDTWHNHLKSCTINGVLYIKTIKGCGLKYCENIDEEIIENLNPEEYENGKNIQYIEPEDYDLLIFPDFISHRPVFPESKVGNDYRLSLNFELRCFEKSIDIFI